MKRSTILVAAGATAAIALAVVIPLAGPASADSGTRLRLLESSDGFHAIDVPAPAADGQAGDLGTFESTLSQSGAPVGRLAGHCIQLRADGSLDSCEVTVTVGRNSFRMAGLFDPATGGTLAITGGTGAWVGAGGTDKIVNQPDGTAIHTVTLKF